MPKETLQYSNGAVKVTWKPKQCIHSTICWKGMREVFDPAKRPWINLDGGDTSSIVAHIQKCPSGALSYTMNDKMDAGTAAEGASGEMLRVEIQPNGPILIKTSCSIRHSTGLEEINKATTALCRCGASANKPYCDGSHNKIGFND